MRADLKEKDMTPQLRAWKNNQPMHELTTDWRYGSPSYYISGNDILIWTENYVWKNTKLLRLEMTFEDPTTLEKIGYEILSATMSNNDVYVIGILKTSGNNEYRDKYVLWKNGKISYFDLANSRRESALKSRSTFYFEPKIFIVKD